MLSLLSMLLLFLQLLLLLLLLFFSFSSFLSRSPSPIPHSRGWGRRVAAGTQWLVEARAVRFFLFRSFHPVSSGFLSRFANCFLSILFCYCQYFSSPVLLLVLISRTQWLVKARPVSPVFLWLFSSVVPMWFQCGSDIWDIWDQRSSVRRSTQFFKNWFCFGFLFKPVLTSHESNKLGSPFHQVSFSWDKS